MTDQTAKGSTERTASSTPTGLSEFISKVLDQLSLTSWMPAAMLVGVGSVVAEFYSETDSPDLASAIDALTSNAIGTAVVMLFGVVIAAVVTQAFSFETIRVLEGYWGLSPVTRLPLRLRVRAHTRHRSNLEAAIESQRRIAFEEARSAMWEHHFPTSFIEVLEDDFYNRDERERRVHPRETTMTARQIGWRVKASPASLGTLDRLERRFAEYPRPHRILPTRLGNVIRAAEDTIKSKNPELEGLIMRHYEVIPPRLMEQHDQFRDRLDMYCTLVPVFGALALASSGLALKGEDFYFAAIAGTSGASLLAGVSYQAAIASARGYGTALKAISERLPQAEGQP